MEFLRQLFLVFFMLVITLIHGSQCKSVPDSESGSDLVHIGCYDDWNNNILKYTTSLFVEKNHLDACAEICSMREHSFVLLKGTYCSCMLWSDFHNTRVEDSICDVECPGSPADICGGNHAMSVYCDKNGQNGHDCERLADESIPDIHASKSEDAAGSAMEPVFSCVNCTSSLGSCITSSVTPAYDYLPENSPSTCAEYCSRPVSSYAFLGELTVRQPTKYALAGWDTRIGYGKSILPICKCSQIIFDHFSEVDVSFCEKKCPETDELCGSIQKGVFTAYCVERDGCAENN